MKVKTSSFVMVNAKKCIGCRACERACVAKHIDKELGDKVGDIEIPKIARLFFDEEKKPFVPIHCRHCENSPCMKACRLGAISKKDGAVIVDQEKCVGCGLCTKACPFGAVKVLPKYKKKDNKLKKAAYKCDLCNGEEPACVKACPKDALKLVNVDEDKKNKNIRSALMFKIK